MELTVCTATVGDSERRLRTLIPELQKFSDKEFKHVVVDDRTDIEDLLNKQKAVCQDYGVTHVIRSGSSDPGLPDTLNCAANVTTSDWIYFVEDGVRPPKDWLSSITSFIEQVDDLSVCGRKVGMIGTPHIQDWMLAMAKVFPRSAMDHYYHRAGCLDEFYGDWNDGLWCWPRMMDGLAKAALSGEAAEWENEVAVTRDLILGKAIDYLDDFEQWQSDLKFRHKDRWPSYRGATVAWYPGGLIAVRRSALEECGGFRRGCTFYEGHLGIRMAVNGYWSLSLECAPWYHAPSQGFSSASSLPVPKRQTRDTNAILQEDFGTTVKDALGYIRQFVDESEEQTATSRFREISCSLSDDWVEWINKDVDL